MQCPEYYRKTTLGQWHVCLVMPWHFVSPGHQLTWYWLHICTCSTLLPFCMCWTDLCHFSVKEILIYMNFKCLLPWFKIIIIEIINICVIIFFSSSTWIKNVFIGYVLERPIFDTTLRQYSVIQLFCVPHVFILCNIVVCINSWSQTRSMCLYATTTEIILCMRPANERRRYNVTSSHIGWAHA